VKYFSTIELIALFADRDWLDEVTKTVSSYWRRKNERRKGALVATRAAALQLN